MYIYIFTFKDNFKGKLSSSASTLKTKAFTLSPIENNSLGLSTVASDTL